MPDHILYKAATADEVDACAYALLKHLDVCNLKPAQSVVIYTSQPAQLEVYGSFFKGFELKPLPEADPVETFARGTRGSVLYLGPYTYPLKPLDDLFARIRTGSVFALDPGRPDPAAAHPQVFGFAAEDARSFDNALRTTPHHSTDGHIASYPGFRDFRALLRDFFRRYQEESVPNQVKLLHPIDATGIRADKQAFLQLPLHRRLLRTITGKGWSISRYKR